MPTLTADLRQLVDEFVSAVETSVRASVSERVNGIISTMMGGLSGAAAPTRATRSSKSTAVSAPTVATAHSAVAKSPSRGVRLCPVPGCGKPAAGPKYQWRCKDHGVLKTTKVASVPAVPSAEKPAASASSATTSAAPKPSTGDATMCRFPGCPNKHSGPRMDFFCREHFASVSAADRQMYKAQWNAQHFQA